LLLRSSPPPPPLGLLAAATAAAASPAPPNDGNGFPAAPQSPANAPVTTIVHNGSPWWTFVLVAAVAVAVTLLVSLAASRIRRHTASAQLAH
jgi:ABC-type branched-subunit amino acid transport system permease subunit